MSTEKIKVRIFLPNEQTTQAIPFTRDYERVVRANDPDHALASMIARFDDFARKSEIVPANITV